MHEQPTTARAAAAAVSCRVGVVVVHVILLNEHARDLDNAAQHLAAREKDGGECGAGLPEGPAEGGRVEALGASNVGCGDGREGEGAGLGWRVCYRRLWRVHFSFFFLLWIIGDFREVRV
jgi:hypothetical protein